MINFKFLCCTFSAFSLTIWLCSAVHDCRRQSSYAVEQPYSALRQNFQTHSVERRATDVSSIRCRLRWHMFHFTSEVLLLFPGHTPLFTIHGSIDFGQWTSTSTQDFDTQMSRSSYLPALRCPHYPLYLLSHTCDLKSVKL